MSKIVEQDRIAHGKFADLVAPEERYILRLHEGFFNLLLLIINYFIFLFIQFKKKKKRMYIINSLWMDLFNFYSK